MKLFLVLLGSLVAAAGARRVRVRPVGGIEALGAPQQQVEYYAEQEEDEGPILVSRQDTYGRATGQSRLQPKLKPDSHRPPPVQTIRNYNKLNDDGSFTFGYEAADGSFKEETRGTDCVVRGKYGYIDPDGNKREFTYVSGNPCDPNAVNQEEEEEESVRSGEEENIPKGLPIRRPAHKALPRPTPQPQLHHRPATTVFEQDYNRDSIEENLPQQRPTLQVVPQQAVLEPRPVYRQYPIPTFAQLEEEIRPTVLRTHQVTARPTSPPILLQPTPAPNRGRTQQAIAITPRPKQKELPATTYRPIHVTGTTAKPSSPSPPPPQSLSFDQEVKNFQLENNVVSTPRPVLPKKAQNQPVYTSELVFDPSTGQYNTVVYQQLPQTQGDFSLRGRLQPFVSPQAQYYRPRPQYVPPSQQDLFQQQQAALVQQSQQLFAAQQQRKLGQKPIPQSLFQQEPQRFAPQPTPKPFAPSQPFYYVAPDRGVAHGQIDAFLRGHQITL